MTETFNRILDSITGWIFEMIVQPAMYELGLMDWADDAIDWIQFGLFGVASILVVYVVCRPLEAWRPVEPVTDRRAIRTDIFYTLLTRLGVLPLVAFVLLNSLSAWWAGAVADSGFVPPTLETLIPGLREMPILAFCLYIVILDFGEYWRHRFQHRLGWWWALHSIHHAQRQMTFWTDDRNHILDEMLAALWFGAIALAIGVPPGQFPLLVMVMRLAESLSHANVRLSFGRVGERLLVSPRFHRLHHGVLSTADHGKNYAVLLPVWDWVFGTADFNRDAYPRTGDLEAPEALATGGWLRQQFIGLKRMASAIAGRPGY